MRDRRFVVAASLAIMSALWPPTVAAQQRYAVVVSGAAGGDTYASKLDAWRRQLVSVLREKLAFDADHVTVLCDCANAGAAEGQPATRDRVSAAVERLARDTGPKDLVLIVLMGHGSFDGVDAKFNLVGPDLGAGEWRDLLRAVRSRVVLVNTTGASMPFVEQLSAPRRVVIAATETGAQRFDTVFPEYFVAALADAAADLDKDGRISVLEAFSAASRAVKQHYERAGQLPIERAVLDDNGDRVGKWAGGDGTDGATAARTFLDGQEAEMPADPVLAELFQRRAALEAQVDELRARKPLMSADEYAKEFERVMIDLARVSREIRKKKS